MQSSGDSVLFRSGRHFQVWAYTVGHSQLLLRSVKDEKHLTRVDLVFKLVGFQFVPRAFRGIEIAKVKDDPALPISNLSEATDGLSLCKLASNAVDWYVSAASFAQNEDDCEYFEPDIWGVLG